MCEAEEAAMQASLNAGNSLPDHCPKHGGNGSGKNEILIGDNKDTILGVDQPSNPNQVTLASGSGAGGNGAGPGGPGGNGATSGGGGSGKKTRPKRDYEETKRTRYLYRSGVKGDFSLHIYFVEYYLLASFQ